MNFNRLKTYFLVLITFFSFVNESAAQNEKEHIEVVMRMIGHQILLNSGDSSSLVLPIENEGDKFRIRFQSEFQFIPNKFAASIDSIFQLTNVTKRYRIEVENCDTRQIVYSYEIDSTLNTVVPCVLRSQPMAQYSLLVTILDSITPNTSQLEESQDQKSGNSMLIVSILVAFVLLGIAIYFWKRKSNSSVNSNIINIGKYRFDHNNMKLLIKKECIDLTSKEADLLALLQSSLNVTIEREVILKEVWGDDGDYVGRTLDVFISKLRKKFSEDSTVKIVNVRGVGYKLMLDTSSTISG